MAERVRPDIDLTTACACGAVTVAIKGTVYSMFMCSCEDCQKASGTGHSAVFTTDPASLTVTGETRSFTRPSDSGAHLHALLLPGVRHTALRPLEPQRSRRDDPRRPSRSRSNLVRADPAHLLAQPPRLGYRRQRSASPRQISRKLTNVRCLRRTCRSHPGAYRPQAWHTEKKMFGGFGFMLNGNMVCGAMSTGALLMRVGARSLQGRVEPARRAADAPGRPRDGRLRRSNRRYRGRRRAEGLDRLCVEVRKDAAVEVAVSAPNSAALPDVGASQVWRSAAANPDRAGQTLSLCRSCDQP